MPRLIIRTSPHRNSYFANFLDFSCLSSQIEFQNPLKDFRGNENQRLTLWLSVLSFYPDSSFFPDGHYWFLNLKDSQNRTLATEKFGKLEKHLSNYSSKQLREWQDQAYKKYDEVLQQLGRIYRAREIIPGDVLV